MKTILILCPDVPYPPINGPRLDAWEQVRFFKSLGWTPVVSVCRTADEPHQDEVSIADILTHEVRRNPRWSMRESAETVRTVQRWIDQYKPSVVLCEGAELAPLAAKLELTGRRLWFRPIDFVLAQTYETISAQAWRRKLRYGGHYLGKLMRIQQIERLMFRIADWVLHIGYADMVAMRRVYRYETPRDWIPPLVERDQVKVISDKSPIDVVYMASDYRHVMGQPAAELIVKAIAPVLEAYMPGRFRFHLIGDRQEKNGDMVLWHGYVDDLPGFMKQMDVACLPVGIGWGCKLKLVESLAYGLPVIGALETFRGIPEGHAGIVCKTVEEYVDALIKLADPAAREKIGSAGLMAYNRWREEGKRLLMTALEESDQVQ